MCTLMPCYCLSHAFRLDAKFWKRNKEMAVRLAVQKLENLMRR
jgi:hypothetical protein